MNNLWNVKNFILNPDMFSTLHIFLHHINTGGIKENNFHHLSEESSGKEKGM